MSISFARQTNFDLNDLNNIEGAKHTERRLSDLEGFFADEEAYELALQKNDPVIYHVQSITPANGKGDLHYGLGTLMPGKIGREYYLTKGHFHSWREAAEVYIGLEGIGRMLLEDEKSGESKMLSLQKNSIVYVPGHTAHRTVNCGDVPLKYIGIYPAGAGHDYGAIAERNFHSVIAEIEGNPQMIERKAFLNEFV
jgi:glucose-6-phosphate isomerase